MFVVASCYTADAASPSAFVVKADGAARSLEVVGAYDIGRNASFLTLLPDGRRGVCVNEGTDGAITTFAVAAEAGGFALHKGHTVASRGEDPCHVSVHRDGRWLVSGCLSRLAAAAADLPLCWPCRLSATTPTHRPREAWHWWMLQRTCRPSQTSWPTLAAPAR